jgi:hypothetical protein
MDNPHRSQGPRSLITLNILGGMTWGKASNVWLEEEFDHAIVG